ncbi:3-phosphoshikimate 1-carboxyvinyltransferase [Syntrophomonas wolfei]|jgi:3-phosphoshikimate 1-carboxyvinyltransferase|uniref:3-phosphoshikimate 1-carboxyvinyltransferase n=1 Tax=Syntrophomonas wolfei TaxID=863 RepID=UPI0007737A45|nr:3-phosphoshikimate 1-carboxyvinyltransferase [Syntrophomonas wolfei]
MRRINSASKPLKGEVSVDADKSISHRAVIFSALAQGKSVIKNFLPASDTLSSCSCLGQLGIKIAARDSEMQVYGRGLTGFSEPHTVLDCGNSGTTMRLMAGLLSGQLFLSILNGDESLNQRPMKRIIEPLGFMGARIQARENGNYPPLVIIGNRLSGLRYQLPVASAQVKSALMLAALNADSETLLSEPQKSRDHSERMLTAMGADIAVNGLEIRLKPGKELQATEFLVPGDISSAAFFMVAASIIPGSELLIRHVGVNPSRAGIIEILKEMGARIKLENERIISGEPVADLIVSHSRLQAVNLDAAIIPRLIDEIPILAVAMALAEGESTVKGAAELRVKETDRIAAISSELAKMGVDIREQPDGFVIKGKPDSLQGARVNSQGDHRIAMSLAVAALASKRESVIEDSEVVNISFPRFWDLLNTVTS